MASRMAERLVTDLGERTRDRMVESRMDKIDRENERLKGEVRALREGLAEERNAFQRALAASSKRDTVTIKRPRRFRLLRTAVIGGGAYLLGTRAGRERYDQIVNAMRSTKDGVRGRVQRPDAGETWQPGSSHAPGGATTLGDGGSATAAPPAG